MVEVIDHGEVPHDESRSLVPACASMSRALRVKLTSAGENLRGHGNPRLGISRGIQPPHRTEGAHLEEAAHGRLPTVVPRETAGFTGFEKERARLDEMGEAPRARSQSRQRDLLPA